MKKITFLLSFFLCMATQNSFGQFSAGVSSGVNLFNPSFSEDFSVFSVKSKFNYYFGITPKYQINSKLAILSDIEFSVKSWENDFGFEGADALVVPGNIHNRYTYFDINPEVEYRVFKVVGIAGGVYFGYLLDEEQKFGDGDWFSVADFGLLKKIDVGLSASVRAYLKRFYAMVSYNHGLINVTDLSFSNRIGGTVSGTQYNRSLQLGVGFYIFQGE